MEEANKKRLRGNCTVIVRQVEVEHVKDQLYEDGILTDEELDLVTLRGQTKQAATRKLLMIILRKDAFEPFCKALRRDYDWLETKIRETDPDSVADQVAGDGSQSRPIDDIDAADKVEVLQYQLFVQTRLIMDYERQAAEIRNKSKTAEKTKEDIAKDKVSLEELQSAMQKEGMSVQDVLRMLELQRKGDDTDSAAHTPRKQSFTSISLDLTVTVAQTLAHDVVNFIVLGEENVSAPKSKYEVTMRRTVKELSENHLEFFQTTLSVINVTEISGFNTLRTVADEVFSGEPNWGRVVAFYAFCAWLAKQCGDENTKMVGYIADFLGIYVADNLKEWIERVGGWVSSLGFLKCCCPLVQFYSLIFSQEKTSFKLKFWRFPDIISENLDVLNLYNFSPRKPNLLKNQQKFWMFLEQFQLVGHNSRLTLQV